MSISKVMRKSFYGNIFLVAIKIAFGFLFQSMSLIADGVHSISDLLSDVFVLLGVKHSEKPADEEHPFGHGKFEYVLSLLLGFSIITIAYNLGRSVIMNFNDISIIPSKLSIIIVIIVVVLKWFLSRYLLIKGKELDSEIVSASGQESLSDVFSSMIVLIGIVSVLLGQYLSVDWLLKGDKIASLFIALFIIRIGVIIVYNAIVSLQGKAVKKEIRETYEQEIKSIKGVIKVDQLIMIAYGPYYQVLVDIRVKGSMTVTEGHDIAKCVSDTLYKDEKINHVIVHVNPDHD